MWPSLQEARDICDAVGVAKTAKNLRPLEIQRLPTSEDPVAKSRKYQKMVNKAKAITIEANEAYAAYKARNLEQRIRSPSYADVPDWRDSDNYKNSEAVYGTMDIGGSLIDRMVSPAPTVEKRRFPSEVQKTKVQWTLTCKIAWPISTSG